MTFTVIEIYSYTVNSYSLDIEDLGELFALGHDTYGDAPMRINWSEMIITVSLG